MAETTPKKSFSLPFYITGTMLFLSMLSARLATRFALFLFFKPLPFPIPRREMSFREKCHRHELQLDHKPFLIFESKAEQSRGKVLFIHGWSGRASQGFKLAEAINDAGYDFFGVEAPGHGDLPDKKSHMIEFIEALRKAQEHFGPFSMAIGHSLGGMAIFNARTSGFVADKVVTIGSPANIRNVVGDFCEKVKANTKVRDGIIHYLEKRYALTVEDYSTDTLARDQNPPGLIIHDEQDLDVPARNGRELKDDWQNAELIITHGLGHRKVLMDDKIIERILSALEN